MKSDDLLYREFLDGDIDAYDQLMVRYGDSLTMYLYGYIHDWQDSEDLMIEAFARVMAKKPDIGSGNFKAYLYRTGRNLAARFHSVMSQVTVFSFDDYGGDIADSEIIEEKLLDEEKAKILHICLDRIDDRLREVIWLVYFEDMSYKEAAAVMGVNTKRIDHLLTRGKQVMRTELEKEGITSANR